LNTSEDKHRESFPKKDLKATEYSKLNPFGTILWYLNKHKYHTQDNKCLIHTNKQNVYTNIQYN